MQGIRRLKPDDVERVAGLFQSLFRGRSDAPPPSLARYIRDVYLDHPAYTPELSSLVSTRADGVVNGFIGILPLRMRCRGVVVHAAVAGALMVERPRENPLAGARLLRAFFDGPQDISYSDTANARSCQLWERLGGYMIPSLSLEWFRVFRPAGFALAYADEKLPRLPASHLRPLARLVDRALARREDGAASGQAEAAPRWRDEPADDAALLEAIPRLLEPHALRPDWSPETLAWLLAQAGRKERWGPLVRRLVRDGRGRVAGAYLCYGRPGGVAEVLQVFAAPGAGGSVLDALMAHARDAGCVGIRGKTEPALMADLIRRDAYFRHPWSVVAHARRPELAEVLRSERLVFGGLAGEWWTRFVSDTFH